MNNRIPKVIHYCWFGGAPLSDEARRCIESWKKYCPDYKIIEWNEGNFDLSSSIYAKEAYAAKKWAFITDYVRLRVMYDYGGIYMDTDVELVGPLDGLLHHRAFSGFESSGNIPTGIMACEKNFELFGEFLNYYTNRHFILSDGTLDMKTNVAIMTDICKTYGLKINNTKQDINGFIIYPSSVFCPKSLVSGEICKTDSTIAIHHFAGSWLEPGDAKLKKIRLRLCDRYGYKTGVLLYKTIYTPYRLYIHARYKGLRATLRRRTKK